MGPAQLPAAVRCCMHCMHALLAPTCPCLPKPLAVLQQDFDRLLRVMAVFVGVTIPAALVNSGLKYMQVRRRGAEEG